MSYEIEFSESVKAQLRSLSARERSIVIEAVEEQLVETRNRKLMRPNPLAPWELRIGDLRVFYELTEDEPDIVRILAVRRKEGDRLFIADQEVKLDENN